MPGVLVHEALGLSWQVSLLFGALIAATDPIAVRIPFRQPDAPHRLATIVEREGLFNDGMAHHVPEARGQDLAATAAHLPPAGRLALTSRAHPFVPPRRWPAGVCYTCPHESPRHGRRPPIGQVNGSPIPSSAGQEGVSVD